MDGSSVQAQRTRFLRGLCQALRRHVPGVCDEVDLECASSEVLREALGDALNSVQRADYNERNNQHVAQRVQALLRLLVACGLGAVGVMADAYRPTSYSTGKLRPVGFTRYTASRCVQSKSLRKDHGKEVIRGVVDRIVGDVSTFEWDAHPAFEWDDRVGADGLVVGWVEATDTAAVQYREERREEMRPQNRLAHVHAWDERAAASRTQATRARQVQAPKRAAASEARAR